MDYWFALRLKWGTRFFEYDFAYLHKFLRSAPVNLKNGDLPKECLRVWTTGSQACEQTFRLLRSMTGTFSTIVNFTMKGILERINELNYVASIECSENIVFPWVKRRLLQLNEDL